ncbi:MAG: hypothetical protein Edafosvirus3_79 [Edafosvirus sp.]|uniref:Uncharacterized protein n=1 Tax=Edafosvirus sp. TaxID=2487765 RepID=A0A3G4ZVH5_9VIRU|nr:MAG: hypothetical protein Edafosvirus3_79 [Edafosvirus sp.]
MSQISFNPCIECIENLRNKLFKLKTDYGMIEYRRAKDIALKNFYDIYSGFSSEEINKLVKNGKKFNVDHIIPSEIMTPGERYDNFLFINKEPYHDLHLIMPTLSEINTLRANYVFGSFTDRDKMITKIKSLKAQTKDTSIINGDKIFNNTPIPAKKAESPTTVSRESSLMPLDLGGIRSLPTYNDNYVDANTTMPGRRKGRCEVGSCIFQPSLRFSGDIARITFYFYLMYGYDPSIRPHTFDVPWLGNVYDDQCKGFSFVKFKKFFIDHIVDYYNWSRNDPISVEETNRNKIIMEKIQIPNIFIGYYDQKCSKENCTKDDRYVNSSHAMIEELFFGKTHDHKKYKDMTFFVDEGAVVKPYIAKYDIDLNSHLKKEMDDTVSEKIINTDCAKKIFSDNYLNSKKLIKDSVKFTVTETLPTTTPAPVPAKRRGPIPARRPVPATSSVTPPVTPPMIPPVTPPVTTRATTSIVPTVTPPVTPRATTSIVPTVTPPVTPRATTPIVPTAIPSVTTPVSLPTTVPSKVQSGGNINDINYKKYIKYKTKYLNLKNKKN